MSDQPSIAKRFFLINLWPDQVSMLSSALLPFFIFHPSFSLLVLSSTSSENVPERKTLFWTSSTTWFTSASQTRNLRVELVERRTQSKLCQSGTGTTDKAKQAILLLSVKDYH